MAWSDQELSDSYRDNVAKDGQPQGNKEVGLSLAEEDWLSLASAISLFSTWILYNPAVDVPDDD